MVLLIASIAYFILARAIVRKEGAQSTLGRAIGRDRKGKVSSAMYIVAIPPAFVHPGIAEAIYIIVAVIWLVPDSRIENMVESGGAVAG